jgi:hypothetical protein
VLQAQYNHIEKQNQESTV